MARNGGVEVNTMTIMGSRKSDYPLAQALDLSPGQLVEIIDINSSDPELAPLFVGILTVMEQSFVAQNIGGCENGFGIKLAVPWCNGKSKPICQAASRDRLLRRYPQFAPLECERDKIVVLDLNAGGDALMNRFILRVAEMLKKSSYAGGGFALLRDPNFLQPGEMPHYSLIVAFESDTYSSVFDGLAG